MDTYIAIYAWRLFLSVSTNKILEVEPKETLRKNVVPSETFVKLKIVLHFFHFESL